MSVRVSEKNEKIKFQTFILVCAFAIIAIHPNIKLLYLIRLTDSLGLRAFGNI